MDEAAKKRAAEITARNVAKAKAAATAATPSGSSKRLSPKESADAVTREYLAKSAGEQPAGPEEGGGMLATIGNFLKDSGFALPQAGDLDAKAVMAPNMGILAPVVGLSGILDTLQNRDERNGAITPVTTALTAGADVGTLGTLNTMRGTVDTLLPMMFDVSGDGYNQSLAENIDMRALEQEEIRAANPGTALGADIAASIATGGGIAKLGYGALQKYAPSLAGKVGGSWTGRLLFGSTAGGAEAGLYRLNKDGDLERAVQDMALATLGGIAIGGIFSTGKGLLNIVRNKATPDMVQESVGRELIDMINIEKQAQGLPLATAADVAADVAKLGPDATLMDAYPSLRELGAMVLKNEDSIKNGVGLREVIALRKDLLQDILAEDGTLRTAFASQSARGPQQFAADAAARRKALGPRYKAAIAANSDVTFSSTQIKDNVTKLFGDVKNRTVGQLELIDFVEETMKKYRKAVTGGKKGVELPDELSLDNLLDMRRIIGKSTGQAVAKVAGKKGTVSLDNVDSFELAQVTKYISGLIHQKTTGLDVLDKVYGNVGQLNNAYEAGRKIFAGAATDDYAVKSFLTGERSAAQNRAFVEGAKYKLFEMLKSADSADKISAKIAENMTVINRMKAMFGEQAFQAMLDDVVPQVTKLKTKEVLSKAVESMTSAGPAPRNVPVGKAIDVATAVGGAPGVVSKAGAFGALRRLMGQAVDPAEMSQKREMYGEILSKMGSNASSAYKGLEELMNRSIRPSDLSGMAQVGATAAATPKAVDTVTGEDSDGALPQ